MQKNWVCLHRLVLRRLVLRRLVLRRLVLRRLGLRRLVLRRLGLRRLVLRRFGLMVCGGGVCWCASVGAKSKVDTIQIQKL